MGAQKNWSQEEIKYLQEAWGKTSLQGICKHLGRSKTGVILKASRLSLGAFKDGDGVMTLGQLIIALVGTKGSYSWQKQKLLRYGLPIIKKKIRTKIILKVNIEDFWEWAKENKSVIDWSKTEENFLGKEPTWVAERRKLDFHNKPKYNRVWSSIEDAQLKAYTEKGLTHNEISERLNRSSCAVRKRIYDLYLQHPKREKPKLWTKQETELAQELRKQGYSYKSIAEKLNRSQEAVRGRLDRIEVRE